MKQVTLIFLCLTFFSTAASAQNYTTVSSERTSVHFKIRNNSILPSKVTVISYRPDETGNGTSGYLLMPYANRKLSFPVGTKIYLANSKQVDIVMSGSNITNDKPFLVVKKVDEGQVFDIKL